MNMLRDNGKLEDAGFYEKLGLATSLLAACHRRTFPISAIKYWIEPAVVLDQIKFFYDPSGRPVGYITWAFLSAPVSQLMRQDRINVLHLSEWNEGLELWLLDLVAPFGHAKAICRHVRDSTFREWTSAISIKRAADDRMVRLRKFRGRGTRTQGSPRQAMVDSTLYSS